MYFSTLPLSLFCLTLLHFPRTDSIGDSDRSAIREKIKSAFRKKAETYDELLELSSSVIEEQVMSNAPSKLDFYKAGISCCKRIFEISNANNSTVSQTDDKTNGDNDENGPKPVKRAKTQH